MLAESGGRSVVEEGSLTLEPTTVLTSKLKAAREATSIHASFRRPMFVLLRIQRTLLDNR